MERAKKDDASEASERKNKRDLGEVGERACRHFFKNLIPVNQLLVYPLIGQFRQFTSTLRIHVNHTAESTRGATFDIFQVRTVRDFLYYFTGLHVFEISQFKYSSSKREKEICFIYLALVKSDIADRPTGEEFDLSPRLMTSTELRRNQKCIRSSWPDTYKM